ncbi:MAG: hypothetical protein PVJ02_05940 [Gemmatimonadota bacterium]|jgi:hypothetical protein
MSHDDAVSAHPEEAQPEEVQESPFGPLPDDANPAIIDAEHTFIITVIGAALFIGAVFVFIL